MNIPQKQNVAEKPHLRKKVVSNNKIVMMVEWSQYFVEPITNVIHQQHILNVMVCISLVTFHPLC